MSFAVGDWVVCVDAWTHPMILQYCTALDWLARTSLREGAAYVVSGVAVLGDVPACYLVELPSDRPFPQWRFRKITGGGAVSGYEGGDAAGDEGMSFVGRYFVHPVEMRQGGGRSRKPYRRWVEPITYVIDDGPLYAPVYRAWFVWATPLAGQIVTKRRPFHLSHLKPELRAEIQAAHPETRS